MTRRNRTFYKQALAVSLVTLMFAGTTAASATEDSPADHTPSAVDTTDAHDAPTAEPANQPADLPTIEAPETQQAPESIDEAPGQSSVETPKVEPTDDTELNIQSLVDSGLSPEEIQRKVDEFFVRPDLEALDTSNLGPVAADSATAAAPQYSCSAFPDVPQSHKFATEIEWMKQSGLTTGVRTSSGIKFMPRSSLTREAMAAFMFRDTVGSSWYPSVESPFRDVKKGHKFYKEIMWMYESGLTTGIRTPQGLTYGPKQSLTREAMAAFLYRLSGERYQAPSRSPFHDVNRNHKFYTAITWMKKSGLSTGISRPSGGVVYQPSSKLTREALAAFLYRQSGSPAVSNSCLKNWANATYGSFKSKTISGYGSDIVSIPARAGIATVSHSGSSNFVVKSLDKHYGWVDLIVNEIGAYSGMRAFGLNDSDWNASKLEIRADGEWSIRFSPVSAAANLGKGNSSDRVFLYGGPAAALQAQHSGSSNFAIWQHGPSADERDLLINEIGYYSGTVPINAGPSVIDVKADGAFTLKTRN